MSAIIRQRRMYLIAAAVSVAAVLFCGCSDTSIGGAFGEQKHANRPAGHVHDWGSWDVMTPATCEAAGVETRTCKLDASHKETQLIPQLTGDACQLGGGGVVDPSTVVKSSFTDSRNGQTYKTVKIGSQRWMAENLNYTMANSWCYGEGGQVYDVFAYGDGVTLTSTQIQDNCNTYGRLYTWNAAKTACPTGWHLPTRDECDQLFESVSGTKFDDYGNWSAWSVEFDNDAGKKLKSQYGWYYDGNGTDDFQFSALPGGYRYSDGNFYDAGYYGYWWTATDNADDWGMGYDCYIDEYAINKCDGLSVRCVEGD